MAKSGTAQVDDVELDVRASGGEDDAAETPRSWPAIVVSVLGVWLSLYIFLVGLQLLGDSVTCLGGRGAGTMFGAVENPITGLMTGVLTTVMVQSSATTTSVLVGMVGAKQVSVKSGIPIIMGANIGTTVTNTIISMGQAADRIQLQRAFAGAAVHDVFNMLAVAVLFPIEVVIAAIEGEGGPLYWLTKVITDACLGRPRGGDELFFSPIRAITEPAARLFISNDRNVISALALGSPTARAPSKVNASACLPLPLGAAAYPGAYDSGLDDDDRPRRAEVDTGGNGAAARGVGSSSSSSSGGGSSSSSSSSRSAGSSTSAPPLRGSTGAPVPAREARDCSRFFCVGRDLDELFRQSSAAAYERELTKCAGRIAEPAEPCGGDECYLDAGRFYASHIEKGSIIRGGFTEGAGNVGGGLVSLMLALVMLVGGIFFMCKLLQRVFMGRARGLVVRAAALNDCVALLVGIGITVVVQSSSVVTSALTPLCGLGLLPLAKMLPLTLGANIGTTVTTLIASLATFTHGSVQIALCHLFFNVFGVLIWYPVPAARRAILGAAGLLGLYASYYRGAPLLYVLVAFVAVPGAALGVAALFGASPAGGAVLLAALLLALACFLLWWLCLGGCYRVLSEEQRRCGRAALERADREARGDLRRLRCAAFTSESRSGALPKLEGGVVGRSALEEADGDVCAKPRKASTAQGRARAAVGARPQLHSSEEAQGRAAVVPAAGAATLCGAPGRSPPVELRQEPEERRCPPSGVLFGAIIMPGSPTVGCCPFGRWGL